MHQSIKEHVYRAIKAAKLVLKPYPHFYISRVFPEEFYSRLLQSLPVDADYRSHSEKYNSRKAIMMTASVAKGLGGDVSAFWQPFEAWLNSQELLDNMTAKFASHLGQNYEYRKHRLAKHTLPGGRVRVTPRSLLVRDSGDFSLGPHSDSENKFVVGAFYLPRDHSLRDFGTSIYEPKQPGYIDWDSPHLPHEDFRLVRTTENAPNSLFVFMKTDNSWHGVEKKAHSNVGRDVLFWIPQVGSANGAESELSLPASIFEPRKSMLDKLLGRGRI